jgi:hypothetical protein
MAQANLSHMNNLVYQLKYVDLKGSFRVFRFYICLLFLVCIVACKKHNSQEDDPVLKNQISGNYQYTDFSWEVLRPDNSYELKDHQYATLAVEYLGGDQLKLIFNSDSPTEVPKIFVVNATYSGNPSSDTWYYFRQLIDSTASEWKGIQGTFRHFPSIDSTIYFSSFYLQITRDGNGNNIPPQVRSYATMRKL